MKAGDQYMELEEYALAFQSGEERGFTWFFRSLYPSLTFFANKITKDNTVAEEIASFAFVKIWERHSQFSSPESIKAYLYQIVRNDALKWLKKGQTEAKAFKEISYLWAADQEKDCFQTLVTAETTRQLQEAIKLLPPACSKVFQLLYVEGMTVKEAASELNITSGTVRTQKARGLTQLHKRLASFYTKLLLF